MSDRDKLRKSTCGQPLHIAYKGCFKTRSQESKVKRKEIAILVTRYLKPVDKQHKALTCHQWVMGNECINNSTYCYSLERMLSSISDRAISQ